MDWTKPRKKRIDLSISMKGRKGIKKLEVEYTDFFEDSRSVSLIWVSQMRDNLHKTKGRNTQTALTVQNLTFHCFVTVFDSILCVVPNDIIFWNLCSTEPVFSNKCRSLGVKMHITRKVYSENVINHSLPLSARIVQCTLLCSPT